MRGQPYSQAKRLPPPSIVDGSASPAVAGPTRTTSEVRRIGHCNVRLGHIGPAPEVDSSEGSGVAPCRTGDGGCELSLGNASVGRSVVDAEGCEVFLFSFC